MCRYSSVWGRASPEGTVLQTSRLWGSSVLTDSLPHVVLRVTTEHNFLAHCLLCLPLKASKIDAVIVSPSDMPTWLRAGLEIYSALPHEKATERGCLYTAEWPCSKWFSMKRPSAKKKKKKTKHVFDRGPIEIPLWWMQTHLSSTLEDALCHYPSEGCCSCEGWKPTRS